jgi:predicted HAD superfamily hydrolase
MINAYLDRAWLEQFSKRMSNVAAVTFDVFDTALTRRVEAPVDVFALVEHFLVSQYGDLFADFAEMRELCELLARKNAVRHGLEEITFEEIYEELRQHLPDADSLIQEVMKAELNAELCVLVATPEILEAVRLARAADKQICFVSDMYFSGAVIKDFLMANGFPEDISVISSSETRRTKATGKQWPFVKQFLEQKEILHIGDDAHSDGYTPERHGLQTLLIDRYRSDRRPGGDLTRSILPFSRAKRRATLLQKDQSNAELMYAFGKSYGVIVVGSFIKWLEERAKINGIEHIFFLSRDGYLLQKAWQAANCSVRTKITESYLYTSRRVLYLSEAAIPDKSGLLKQHSINYICRDRSLTIRNLLERSKLIGSKEILRDCAHREIDLDKQLDDSTDRIFKSVLQNNREHVFDALKQTREITEAYLRQEKVDRKNAAIVDLGWHGSIQTAINNIIRGNDQERLCGFYFGLWPNATQNRMFSGWMEGAYTVDFIPIHERLGVQNSVAILENLHSSPDGSTINYRFINNSYVPEMQEAEIHRRQFEEILRPFQIGTLEGISQLFEFGSLGDLSITDLSIEAGLAAIQRISLSPTSKELDILGGILHSRTFDHTHLTPIIPKMDTPRIQEISKSIPWQECEWPLGYYLCCMHKSDPHERDTIKREFQGLIEIFSGRTRKALA